MESIAINKTVSKTMVLLCCFTCFLISSFDFIRRRPLYFDLVMELLISSLTSVLT